MRGRYVVRLQPADVGRRVTVRSRIVAAPGEPRLTDVVGILLSWDGGSLRIERRDGSVQEVDERDVVAARVVGPAPGGGRRNRTAD
jgi:N-acetylglutamate synthase